MANPTIKELQNEEKFELVAKLNHEQIKTFVIEQLTKKSKIIFAYMIYQTVMVFTGIFFVIYSFFTIFQGNFLPLIFVLAALVFSLSFLIIIHEGIHGIALKLTGAKTIRFGAYFRKFIFYAEANRHVLNRKQFMLIALAPLLVVQILTFAGIVLHLHQPFVYFWIITMSVHSLFCAGDVGLLSVFYSSDNELYTFDVNEEKQSYFYRKKNQLKIVVCCEYLNNNFSRPFFCIGVCQRIYGGRLINVGRSKQFGCKEVNYCEVVPHF